MRRARVGAGLLMLTTAAGCGSAEPAAMVGVEGVTVLATSPTDSATEALIEGAVLTVVDGCLGLEGARASIR